MKEDIMLTSQITVHNNFIFIVNTIPVLEGRYGESPAIFSTDTKCLLSVLVEQFRPCEQRCVFKLILFMVGRVITLSSQSRR